MKCGPSTMWFLPLFIRRTYCAVRLYVFMCMSECTGEWSEQGEFDFSQNPMLESDRIIENCKEWRDSWRIRDSDLYCEIGIRAQFHDISRANDNPLVTSDRTESRHSQLFAILNGFFSIPACGVGFFKKWNSPWGWVYVKVCHLPVCCTDGYIRMIYDVVECILFDQRIVRLLFFVSDFDAFQNTVYAIGSNLDA